MWSQGGGRAHRGALQCGGSAKRQREPGVGGPPAHSAPEGWSPPPTHTHTRCFSLTSGSNSAVDSVLFECEVTSWGATFTPSEKPAPREERLPGRPSPCYR